jgi:hypothetical protein
MALTDSLISFWELEAASGNRIDSTATGNTLTDSGATLSTTGLVGNCPVFATTNLFHTTNASLETGDIDWTIAGWVKFAGWSTDYTVISKWPFPNSQNEYVIYYDESLDELGFLIELGDDSGVLGMSSGSIPNLDTSWHFFFCGHDSVNNQIFLSVDNETTNTLANTLGMHVGNGNFELGGIAFGGAFNFTGNIDQVGFWKRVLTAQERAWLYNSGAGRSYAAVVTGLEVNIGVYDAEMRDLAWHDTSALMEGWWDYGMPFEHDLITAPTPAPPGAGTWPGWITSGSIGWF